MGKKREPFDSPQKQEATRRLVDDLSAFNTQALPTSTVEDEMLSLMVSEAIKGVDISKRYPTFYQKLLSDPNLRQSFIDLLQLGDEKDDSIPFLEVTPADLDFLSQRLLEPRLEKLGKDKWLTSWTQAIEQLQAIFSLPALAPREDLSLLEDRWFMLLRGETKIGASIYTFDLEGTFPEGETEVLSAFLDLAVTLEVAGGPRHFPIQATLQWGSYQASLLLSQEGRIRFPNIPFTSVFDNELKHIKSDLNFSLEIVE